MMEVDAVGAAVTNGKAAGVSTTAAVVAAAAGEVVAVVVGRVGALKGEANLTGVVFSAGDEAAAAALAAAADTAGAEMADMA